MSTRRALFFSFLDRYAGLVLSVGSSMFIARLLTPEEMGVFSVTMVLILFVSSMRDMGAGQYLVQQKHLDAEQIRAVWTVLLFMGWAMALLVLAAAWPMAAFYGEPEMVSLLCVISVNFVVSPFGSMTYAWLMREMRFELLAIMRLGSGLAGAATSVTMAWQGYGALSLAVGSLVATVVNAALALCFRPARFGWLPRLAGVRQVLAFGSKISASGLVWTAAEGAPELFLGKLQGMAAAAYFSRANGLAMMFQRIVLDATQSVALPLFAKAGRESGDFHAPFILATTYVTVLGWAFFLGVAMLAQPLIHLLYGNQWDNAVTLARLLAIGMAVGLPAAMCTQALMAAGQASGLLKYSLVAASVQVACVAGGAAHSVEGAGVGFIAAQLLVTTGWLCVTRRLVRVRLRPLLVQLLRSAAVALAAAAVPAVYVLAYGLEPSQPYVALLVSALGGGIVFAAALFAFGHPLRMELAKLNRWRTSVR
jgi:O-antigen/teichoic acid export membrane protein